MCEKWPNGVELSLGKEEGSREAKSRERSERVRQNSSRGWRCLPRSTVPPELCAEICRIQISTILCV